MEAHTVIWCAQRVTPIHIFSSTACLTAQVNGWWTVAIYLFLPTITRGIDDGKGKEATEETKTLLRLKNWSTTITIRIHTYIANGCGVAYHMIRSLYCMWHWHRVFLSSIESTFDIGKRKRITLTQSTYKIVFRAIVVHEDALVMASKYGVRHIEIDRYIGRTCEWNSVSTLAETDWCRSLVRSHSIPWDSYDFSLLATSLIK